MRPAEPASGAASRRSRHAALRGPCYLALSPSGVAPGAGRQKREEGGKGAVPSFRPPQGAYSKPVILCSSCGQENPDAARFCFACGNPFDAAPAGLTGRAADRLRRLRRPGRVHRPRRSNSTRRTCAPFSRRTTTSSATSSSRSAGSVEKFIGDAIMAVFGAPTAYGDDPERAVRAALAVRDGVREADERDLHLDLQLRIAVNTGEALVTLGARPGARARRWSPATWSTPPSRLQQAAPVNGVIVGAETYARHARRDRVRARAGGRGQGQGASRSRPGSRSGRCSRGRAQALRRRWSGATRELDVLRGVWERVVGRARSASGHRASGRPESARRGCRRSSSSLRRAAGRPQRPRPVAPVPGEQRLLRLLDAGEAALRDLRERPARGRPRASSASASPSFPRDRRRDGDAAPRRFCSASTPRASVDDREELFFSVRLFVEAVARGRADACWSSRTSTGPTASLLDLIELLAARLRDLPVLVLALARPELLDARPAWGGGLPAYTALKLAPAERGGGGGARGDRLGDVLSEACGSPGSDGRGKPAVHRAARRRR